MDNKPKVKFGSLFADQTGHFIVPLNYAPDNYGVENKVFAYDSEYANTSERSIRIYPANWFTDEYNGIIDLISD